MSRPPYETFKRPTCRGSYRLGTACGHCEKCAWEQREMRRDADKTEIIDARENELRLLLTTARTLKIHLEHFFPSQVNDIADLAEALAPFNAGAGAVNEHG